MHQLAGHLVIHDSSDRDLQQNIFSLAPGTVRTFTVPSSLALVLGIKPKVHQRIVPLARHHDDVAAMPAVAARRAASWDELLPPEGNASVAAVARLYSNSGLINKHNELSAVSS
jgi:hypothetical protein